MQRTSTQAELENEPTKRIRLGGATVTKRNYTAAIIAKFLVSSNNGGTNTSAIMHHYEQQFGHAFNNGELGPSINRFLGSYSNHFIKTNGGWKLVNSVESKIWCENIIVTTHGTDAFPLANRPSMMKSKPKVMQSTSEIITEWVNSVIEGVRKNVCHLCSTNYQSSDNSITPLKKCCKCDEWVDEACLEKNRGTECNHPVCKKCFEEDEDIQKCERCNDWMCGDGSCPSNYECEHCDRSVCVNCNNYCSVCSYRNWHSCVHFCRDCVKPCLECDNPVCDECMIADCSECKSNSCCFSCWEYVKEDDCKICKYWMCSQCLERQSDCDEHPEHQIACTDCLVEQVRDKKGSLETRLGLQIQNTQLTDVLFMFSE
jgi:hypothetical protein